MIYHSIGVEQTPINLCLNREVSGGAAHTGRCALIET
jgi:hypothetical protein